MPPPPKKPAPPLLRRLPSVRLSLDRGEKEEEELDEDSAASAEASEGKAPCGKHCRAVCIHFCRCHCCGTVHTTTISIDVRLFWLLLFLLAGTASGLVLAPGPPRAPNAAAAARAAGVRMDLDDASSGSWASFAAAVGSAGAAAPFVEARPAAARASAVYSSGVERMLQRSKAEQAATATMEEVGGGGGGRARAFEPERLESARQLRERLAAPPEGAPTLVVYAAKSCRACRAMLPKLERVAKQKGARMLVLYHAAATEAAFVEHEVVETPTTYVYDGQGRVVRRQVPDTRDVSELGELLGTLAADAAAEAEQRTTWRSSWGI